MEWRKSNIENLLIKIQNECYHDTEIKIMYDKYDKIFYMIITNFRNEQIDNEEFYTTFTYFTSNKVPTIEEIREQIFGNDLKEENENE